MSVTEYPITEPVRPVVVSRVGKHGRWTPLAEVTQSAAGAARWHARHAVSATAYHAVRTPIYYGRVAQHAPRGMWKVTKNSWRWFTDSDGRQALHNTFDSDESFMSSRRQHREEIKARAFVTFFGATVAVGAGTFGWTQLPDVAQSVLSSYWQPSFIAGLPLGLGLLGRPEGERVVAPAELAPATQRVTSDYIVQALCATMPAIRRAVDQDPTAVRCIVGRDHGRQLWNVLVVLPAGVTADNVTTRRDNLASALGRSPSVVLLDHHESGKANHLVIDLLDHEPRERKQGECPLLSAETVDIHQPFPFGEDELGNVAELSLEETNLLIGSLPGAGKTTAIKTAVAAAVLDPRTELQIFELKGTGDLRQFEPLCTRYAHGKSEDVLTSALKALRALDNKCTRRTELIASLPFEVCPESKVTTEVADIEGLHPIVLVIDEVHRLMLGPDGAEAARLAESIIKVDRALNVKLIFATQRPSASSLPAEIRSQFGTRLCLRVAEQPENDMILGTGAYGEGRDATKIRREDRGMGILDDRMLRVYQLSATQVQKVVDRALFLRGGVVDKHVDAEPEQVVTVASDQGSQLLRDIMQVGPATPEQCEANRAREAAVTMAELVDLLYAHNEDAYRDLNADSLKDRIERAGVKVEKQVNRRRGDKYDSLYKAVQFKHIETQLKENS